MTDYAQEFVDRGGDRIGLHVYPTPPADRGAVAVIWPAMGVPARYYRPFAGNLREAGLSVVVADLRGTGSSTPPPSRRSRYGYAELVDDVAAVQEAVKQRLDGRTRLLIGHSLGGQAALIHLGVAAEPMVDGLVLIAVGLPWFRAYPGRRQAAILGLTQGIAAASAVLGVWPGWRFGGRQARGVIKDWGYTARHGRYPRLGGTDVEAALPAVRTPILAVTVEGDRLTPAATTEHLLGKVPAAPVTREPYTAAQAGGPLDHFRWVRASKPLATRVGQFAEALSGASSPG